MDKLTLTDYMTQLYKSRTQEQRDIYLNVCEKNGIFDVTDCRESCVPVSVLVSDGMPLGVANKLYNTWAEKSGSARPNHHSVNPTAAVASGPHSHADTLSGRIRKSSFVMPMTSVAHLDAELKAEVVSESTKRNVSHIAVALLRTHFGNTNPGREAFTDAALDLMDKYKSLQDSVDGIQIDTAENMMVRIERHYYYKYAPNSEPGSERRRPLSDTVGTVDFAPELPETETEASLLAITENLQQSFLSDDLTDIDQNDRIMNTTLYPSIRKEINKNKSKAIDISKFKEMFPYIFVPQIFLNHFKRLTGVDALEGITKFQTDKLEFFIRYFCQYSSKNVKCSLIKDNMFIPSPPTDDTRLLTVLELISVYFGEDFGHFVVHIKESTTSNEELEAPASRDNIPATPVIVALGATLQSCTRFVLMLNYSVVARVPSFKTALAMLIASFWVLNYKYPPQVNTSCEYLKMVLLRDMVTRQNDGSKSAKKPRKSGAVPIEIQNLSTHMAKIVAQIRSPLEDNSDVEMGEASGI